jgi:hypothetical protein
MSYFDLDADGYGVFLWDTGAAGDGLRGVEDAPNDIDSRIVAWRQDPLNPLGEDWVPNAFSLWTADQSEPELWDGNQLLAGGKHYGFLEVDVEPLDGGEFRVSFQNWHTFPLNAGDDNFTVTGFELREYNNSVVLQGTPDNLRPVTTCPGDINGDNAVGLTDLNIVLSLFGQQSAIGDTNGDGIVDLADLNSVLANFGVSCD